MAKQDKPTTLFVIEREDDRYPYYYRDRAPAEQHQRVLREHLVECRIRTVDVLTTVPPHKSIFRVEVNSRVSGADWVPPRAERIVVFEDERLFRQPLPSNDEWDGWIRGYGSTEEDALKALFEYCESIGWHTYVDTWKVA